MAAHAVSQTLDEDRPFAGAAFFCGLLRRVAHGEQIVAVDGARRYAVALRMLRQPCDFGVSRERRELSVAVVLADKDYRS